jgi:hypothetical protein
MHLRSQVTGNRSKTAWCIPEKERIHRRVFYCGMSGLKMACFLITNLQENSNHVVNLYASDLREMQVDSGSSLPASEDVHTYFPL